MGQGLAALVAPRLGSGQVPRLGSGQAPAHEAAPRTASSDLPPSFDRDLSLIEFYRRVFDEACDEANPLLERVKFLGIVGTILHEFAVTRYPELKKGLGAFFGASSEKGTRPLFLRVEAEVKNLLAQARLYLREQLAPALAREGIHLLRCADLQPKERAEVEAYFTESVLPLLMPLGFDAARPFPHITGRTMALAVVVRDLGNRDKEHFACVQLPEALPALVPFHWRRDQGRARGASSDDAAEAQPDNCAELEQGFVWLDEVVSEHLAAVFPGMEIVQVHPFRIFRDATLSADLPQGVTVPDAVAQDLRRREYGEVLALVVGETMPRPLLELLAKNLGIAPGAAHVSSDLTDLKGLSELSRVERPDLRDAPLVPRAAVGETADIFASIRRGDILLHHPYESFQPVIDFIEKAASDPDVLAISTTLYRAGRNSPIVDALRRARHAGKQVRVVIELRARFDEENNLIWGRALQEAGAHVVYGMVGVKVHAKLTLIVRREAGKLRRYVHLSSGNYNPATSGVYTDLGLLSSREDIAGDATQLFNILTGYASPSAFRALVVAPINLRNRVQDLIEREASWARQGHAAHIILKMNALADPKIIASLYRASQAGVRIDLIVRGICCLRPAVPGVSDNIRVRSIVGRFLEHSRAWYFRNGGNDEIYLGSADLMARNLDERIEVMVPLEDAGLKRRVRQEILDIYLADNVKARELLADGSYVRVNRAAHDAAVNSQECL